MPLIIVLIAIPGLIAFIDFTGFVIKGKSILNKFLIGLAETGSLIILPYLYAGFGKANICCADEIDTAAFSPQHQFTIITIILLSLMSYAFSKFRRDIAPPVIEVVINTCLLIGIILNIFIAFHTTDPFFSILGNVPVILLGTQMLIKNQKLFIQKSRGNRPENINMPERIAWNILSSKPFIKFPVLLIICFPVLFIVSSFLLLFGQKPDAIIRAFTDTYRHGFSQWDYQCANIACGGHYLCSVAAKGHKWIVKPQRIGIRNGNRILCNRQLLISNAFEDLIQKKFPFIHKMIRRHYDKVGKLIHRYYYVFSIKIIADLVYFLMKPLEGLFLCTLYIFDRNPENRIAKQYLKSSDRQFIDSLEQNGTIQQFNNPII